MAEVELTVDGERVDLVDTIRLLQGRPFPGGHGYRLTISGQARVLMDPMVNDAGEVTAGRAQRAVLDAIEMIAARLPGEGEIPARFVLNSVDRVTRDGECLTITGICSVPAD